MIALDGERGRGSGRSIEAFDLLAGLSACARAPAALRRPPRRRRAGDRPQRAWRRSPRPARARRGVLAPADLLPVERVDAVVGGDELGMGLAEELRSLAPFGRANPGVSLMVSDATLPDPRRWAKASTCASRCSRAARARARWPSGPAGAARGRRRARRATFTLEVNEWRASPSRAWCLRQAIAPRRRARPGRVALAGDAGTTRQRGRARAVRAALARFNPGGPSPTL